jgi:hypothetical protein
MILAMGLSILHCGSWFGRSVPATDGRAAATVMSRRAADLTGSASLLILSLSTREC